MDDRLSAKRKIQRNGPLFSPSPSAPGGRGTRRLCALPARLLKPLSLSRALFPVRRFLLVGALLVLVLFTDLLASWPVLQPSNAFAQGMQRHNAALAAPSWLQQAPGQPQVPDLGQYVTNPQPDINGTHPWRVSMQPAKIPLTTAGQHFVSSDQQLVVDIPADSLDATQLAQAGGGGLTLYITQVRPGSGGLNSEHLFFGTYEFQFFDASGRALSALALHHPFTLSYHLRVDQQPLVWQGQQVYALWNAVQGNTIPPDLSATTAVTPNSASASQAPILQFAQMDRTGTIWSVQSGFSASSLAGTATPATRIQLSGQAVAASSVTFGTQAPQATWGKPSDFQVGLSSGSLNYSYPLSIPPGPGGLQPSLELAYASQSVNGNHNLQSTNPWVGQGWSLDPGSISWGQENVTPNGSPTLENVWHINDPSGISGQLIPPDLNFSTIAPYNPSSPTTSQVWHTAPESHARIIEKMFGSMPCWRVYLPGGIMEEFGCTNDSRQTYVDSAGDGVNWRWDLDLMIDRSGNQVHITYQKLHIASNYSRDAVVQDITYDDLTCHNTTTACSTWNPKVDIHFDASQSVTNLQNSGCGSGTSGQYRCDAPRDLSGSGGLPVPKVLNSYVLNDARVEVQGNILSEYVFAYDQGGPQTITDPSTGKSESIAGYLNLKQIQELGTNGTTLNAPIINMTYEHHTTHYSDLFSYAIPSTNCAPTSWSPRDGSSSGPCYLWSESYNAYYLKTLNNGRGWQETINWKVAHSNTHGVDSGAVNEATTCDGNESSTNICGKADDKNWSLIVVSSRTALANGVSSTWTYNHYYLATGLGATFPGTESGSCSQCSQSYDWGNQNDDDSADYYNGTFESFSRVVLTQPDNSTQTDSYTSTNGWGLYNSSITCFIGSPCTTAPFDSGSSGPVLAGKQTKEQDYDSSGNLLKEIDWTYATNCPPPGVSGSVHASGGSIDPGTGRLFSPLDHNNPVMVCDPRVIQEDDYLTDGVTSNTGDARVVHTTTHYTHDGNECGSNYTSGYDYGNTSATDKTATDVGGIHVITEAWHCPNDNLGSGIFLTNLLAKTYVQDQNGNQYGCHTNIYGSNTGDLQAPTVSGVTIMHDHTPYNGTTQNCIGTINTTQRTYNSSGDPITGTDPDNHLGCSSGSSQYTACATYDSTYGTTLLTATNAKNQTTTYAYDSTVNGGFGRWLTSETDVNGQVTTYQYDALGRLLAVTRPADSPSSPTVTYTYINTCTSTGTSACLELDTATRFTSGGPVSTMKQWYDGWGNLIETQTPSPDPAQTILTYSIYDVTGHEKVKSLSYALTTPAGYVTPDQTRARSVTSYDALGRSLGSVTYSDATTIVQSSTLSYTVALGVPTLSSESSTAYEQTITLDAYKHQSISYTDGLGRTRYSQVESGTAIPYSVVRTIGTTYDMLGNTASVTTYDSTGTARASYDATYDGTKELLGYNDSDLGSCQNSPMPADCSGTTDLAWKYTYDGDGNQLSQTDPRNLSTYTSYDMLDRPLCRALTASDSSSCGGSTYAAFFYDGYSNASTPGATFPSGCQAPTGNYASEPIGRKTAELFIGTSGAGSGWRCSGYDQRGQVDQSTLSVTTPDAGAVTQTVNRTYNDGGEATGLVYPDGETTTSTYDTNGHFQSTYFGTPDTPDPVQFLVGQTSYLANGKISGMAIGGSGPKNSVPTAIFSTATTYDGIQRILSDSATEAGQTLWSQTRTYDSVGNVLGLSTVVPTQGGGTATENEAFCYDALNRLMWAGNSGTPSGGDHCMAPPTGTTLTPYTQAYNYDNLDRTGGNVPGAYSYGDENHFHAVTGLTSVPNPYAAYDAMGNMTCRNLDPTSAHTCAAGTPNGAMMTYDTQGQLASWNAPGGTIGSAHYLYDNEGNRVLTSSSNAGTTTDTIYFDGYTETVLSGGTTTTTKYYSVSGQRLAVRIGGSTVDYLLSDPLGSNSVVLNNLGQVIALQHYSPYGTVDYTWGSMPTSFNYAGERLDSQTGLLYDNFRYYDPVTGRFVRSDTVQDNSNGSDPYAYVGNNPETRNDPSGHCWPWCTALIGAAIGAVVGVVITTAKSVIVDHKPPSLGEVLGAAASGALSGVVIGVLGPGASLGAAVGIGALSGALGGAAGGAVQQVASNLASGKGAGDGVLGATLWGGAIGAVTGALTGGLMWGAGKFLNRFAGKALQGAAAAFVDGMRKISTNVGDFSDIAGSNPLLSALRARLPSSAGQPFGPRIVNGFDPNAAISSGYKWVWDDASGNSCMFYCHGINARAPAGSNSSISWTARYFQDGSGWMDTSGTYPPNGYRLNSTHWPMRIW